jgi:hypothetical protein
MAEENFQISRELFRPLIGSSKAVDLADFKIPYDEPKNVIIDNHLLDLNHHTTPVATAISKMPASKKSDELSSKLPVPTRK